MNPNRQEFLELLQRYIDGTCSSEEKQMMDYWYASLDQESGGNPGPEPDTQREEKLWTAIQQRILPSNEPDQQNHLHQWCPPDS